MEDLKLDDPGSGAAAPSAGGLAAGSCGPGPMPKMLLARETGFVGRRSAVPADQEARRRRIRREALQREEEEAAAAARAAKVKQEATAAAAAAGAGVTPWTARSWVSLAPTASPTPPPSSPRSAAVAGSSSSSPPPPSLSLPPPPPTASSRRRKSEDLLPFNGPDEVRFFALLDPAQSLLNAIVLRCKHVQGLEQFMV